MSVQITTTAEYYKELEAENKELKKQMGDK